MSDVKPRTWRERVAARVLGLGCSHPEAIVCSHRQWLYDIAYRGHVRGFASGTRHAEKEQRGLPPYDDHPCLRCGRLDCNDINAIITALAESQP